MRKIIVAFVFTLVTALFSTAYAAYPIEYNESIDATTKDLGFKTSENTLIIAMERPAKPMKPFSIQFYFDKDNVDSLQYSTNMKMNMGNFQSKPTNLGHGKYIASLTLPKCGSGDTLWYGKLEITYKSGKTDVVYFFYDLK